MPIGLLGVLHSLSATAIVSSYTASSAWALGRVPRLRFYVETTLHASSSLTTITIKLQHRYHDATNSITGGYVDLPSYLDDAQGSQPKGPTLEIEHAFTVTAGTTQDFSFYLPSSTGIVEMTVNIKGNTTGHAADLVTVWGSAA